MDIVFLMYKCVLTESDISEIFKSSINVFWYNTYICSMIRGGFMGGVKGERKMPPESSLFSLYLYFFQPSL